MSYNPQSFGSWNTQPIQNYSTLPGKNDKRTSPCNPVMVKALFFLSFFLKPQKNIDRSCLQPGSKNTMCPVHSEKADCVIWAAHYDLTVLHSLMAQCGSPLFIYKTMHSAAKSFKNTSYVVLTGSGIKKRNVRPSSDTTQSSSSECKSTFRITPFRG